MRAILVGVDGSASSDKAVSLAAELASKTGASLLLVDVLPPATVFRKAVEGLIGPDRLGTVPDALAECEPDILDHARRMAAEKSVQSIMTVTLSGDPAVEIIRTARERAVDLIVVGSRGHGLLENLAVGSVAYKLAAHAPCPVLIAR